MNTKQNSNFLDAYSDLLGVEQSMHRHISHYDMHVSEGAACIGHQEYIWLDEHPDVVGRDGIWQRVTEIRDTDIIYTKPVHNYSPMVREVQAIFAA